MFMQQIIPSDQIMIQRWIPGGGGSQYSLAALCQDGKIQTSVVANRTRQWPLDFGGSSTFVEIADDPMITNAGMKESHAHDVEITKESPNYSR